MLGILRVFEILFFNYQYPLCIHYLVGTFFDNNFFFTFFELYHSSFIVIVRGSAFQSVGVQAFDWQGCYWTLYPSLFPRPPSPVFPPAFTFLLEGLLGSKKYIQRNQMGVPKNLETFPEHVYPFWAHQRPFWILQMILCCRR